jgi:hypothetical protein
VGRGGLARLLGQAMLAGIVAAALLGAWAVPALAQNCDNTNPLTITEARQMDFGAIIPVAAGGTVTISTSGVVSGPVGFVFSGSPASGSFNVVGTALCQVTVSFTAGSLAGPGTAMTLNTITSSVSGQPTLNGQGKLSFTVGAKLKVNAAQAGGSYSGSYSVTIIY